MLPSVAFATRVAAMSRAQWLEADATDPADFLSRWIHIWFSSRAQLVRHLLLL
jgi:hypothetical protein